METYLKALQETEKEILDFIVGFCEEKKIPYFLTDGTLLGAIRHKGFIPWDDDVDMGMLRKDYETFIKEFPDYIKGTKYQLETNEVDESCILNFAKVHDTSTVLIQKMTTEAENKHHVFVDIFPFDKEPDNQILAYMQWGRTRLLSLLLNVRTKIARESAKKFPLNLLVKTLEWHYRNYSNQEVFNLRKKLTTKYNQKETKYYSNIVLSKPKTCLIESKTSNQTSTVTFNGKTYQAPFNPDLYLSSYYGDYMTLPPVEKRVNFHQLTYLKLGKNVYDEAYFNGQAPK